MRYYQYHYPSLPRDEILRLADPESIDNLEDFEEAWDIFEHNFTAYARAWAQLDAAMKRLEAYQRWLFRVRERIQLANLQVLPEESRPPTPESTAESTTQ